MKKRFFILCILLFGIFTMYKSPIYASESYPIHFEYLNSKKVIYSTKYINDKVIIRQDSEDYFDSRAFDFVYDSVVKVTSIYNTFYYKNLNSNKIVYFDNFSYLIIDGTKSRSDGLLILKVNSDEAINLVFNDQYELGFIIDDNYLKVDDELTFISDYDNPLLLEEINDLFVAWDFYEGDLTKDIIVTDNYTSNNQVVGTHLVVLNSTDSYGNETSINYYVKVSDLKGPVFQSLEPIIVKPEDVFDFNYQLNNIVVSDNVSIRDNILVTIESNTYVGNEGEIGEYEIVYLAVDESNNETRETQVINVVDMTPPEVIGKLDYTVRYDEKLNYNELLNNLTITDNIDQFSDLRIIKTEDEYQGNETFVGEYKITYFAEDRSKNKTYFTFTIKVVDDQNPVFYININQLVINDMEIYTNEDLLNYYQSQINFLYDDIEIIKNDYTGNEEKIGIYQITLKTSYNGKTTYLNSFIRVNELIPEITPKNKTAFYQNKYFIMGTTTLGVIGLLIGVYLIRKKRKVSFK